MSIQDIRPNPQDTSNFYLANIYQTVADPNRSNISNSPPSSPPIFSPPNYAVWVNSLWFLSLVIGLTCALLATLLQQWARRYLKVTQPRYSPHKRARIRAFFAEGVEKFLLSWVVEVLPTLLHVSLFLFFSGLVVFLFNVYLTIFKLVLPWVGICTVIYGCITFIPIFRHNSPYYTPLTSLASPIVIGVSYVIFRVLRWFTGFTPFSYWAWSRFRHLEKTYRKLLVQGRQKTAEETALNSPSEIDARTFMWTFDSLDEDHELERFFSSLPGFRSSKVVNDPLPSLTPEQKEKLCQAVIGLFDRTFSSNLLPESAKSRRAIICAKALDPATFPTDYRQILNRIMFYDQCRGLQTAEFGHTVRGWAINGNQGTVLVARAIVTGIVARAQRHDDSWFILVSSELGVPETVLRDYAAQGDSLSLSILIHVVRQQFGHFWKPWPRHAFSKVLEAASKFNVQDTSHELQHEFCALWNRIVLKAQTDDDKTMARFILGPIRDIYIAHHPDSTPHIHDDSSTTFAHNVAVPASISSSDAPSSSVPAPLHVVKSLMDVPPLDNPHPAHQKTAGSLRIPITSPDPATAGAIRDVLTSGITMPHPTPAIPTSDPPLPHSLPLPSSTTQTP